MVYVVRVKNLTSSSGIGGLREAGARAPMERKKNAVYQRQKLVGFGGTAPSGNVSTVWVLI